MLGLKHAETEEAFYKARCIALGNSVKGNNGEVVFEEDKMYTSPISIAASRALDVYACLVDGGAVESVDGECAYAQAPLRGDPVWFEPPEHIIPLHLRGKFNRPVVRAEQALYGLYRAGFDWDEHEATLLTGLGWERFVDSE